jgi:DNA-binding CsgD family transcriptional regulator
MTARILSQTERIREAHLDLIDAIYAAAADPSRWNEVAHATTRLVGGGQSGLLMRRGKDFLEQELVATNLDPAFIESYAQHYGAINPWVHAFPGRRPTLYANDTAVPAEELERSEFYADWLRPLGVRYTFNGYIGTDFDTRIEFVGTRPRSVGPFQPDECEVLTSLLPHLKRAVELSRRLQIGATAEAVLGTVLRQSGASLLLVDSHLRVRFMSPEADRLLRTRTDLCVRNERLTALPSVHERLRALVNAATGNGMTIRGRQGGILTIPGFSHDAPTLSVAVGPVDERDRPFGMVGPVAMVLLSVPDLGRAPQEDSLRALFDLTQAEARLVTALCAGETLAGYAAAVGTSLNTVKTHLKHVFDKTGETRQADLVRRISTDLALRIAT